MTLQECYAALGGDYEDAKGRLRSDRLVQKFVLKFLADGSFDLLCQSLEAGNYEEAFRASHTIKGMCQNLSFTQLQESSTQLPEAAPLVEQVKADYQKTAEAIRAFESSLEA